MEVGNKGWGHWRIVQCFTQGYLTRSSQHEHWLQKRERTMKVMGNERSYILVKAVPKGQPSVPWTSDGTAKTFLFGNGHVMSCDPGTSHVSHHDSSHMTRKTFLLHQVLAVLGIRVVTSRGFLFSLF